MGTVGREHILDEIRRTAEENGGTPLGVARFGEATGISQWEWQRYWPRWGEAVSEAGLRPNEMQARFDDDEVLARLAQEVRVLGRMPTKAEVRLRRQADPAFPGVGVFIRLGKYRQERIERLAAWCSDHPEFADVSGILERLLEATPETASHKDRVRDDVEFGFVYLLKSGRNYKVGHTNSFGRRERELAIQLPERVVKVHVIKTDDPPGIEDYWHRRFADRRKNGEWFELTPADVQAFKRRKFM